MYNFYAYINRLKYINRWSLMKNVRGENIMEHSYMTAVVSHALAVINNVYFQGNLIPERAAAIALFHDMSEALTGDMPTPIKYFNPQISAAFKGIESIANDKLISMLPQEMSGTFTSYEDAPERRIVKCADKICAYIKCVEELQVSNKEFARAERSVAKEIKSLDCPEANYFMEHFMPAFKLSLDELD